MCLGPCGCVCIRCTSTLSFFRPLQFPSSFPCLHPLPAPLLFSFDLSSPSISLPYTFPAFHLLFRVLRGINWELSVLWNRRRATLLCACAETVRLSFTLRYCENNELCFFLMSSFEAASRVSWTQSRTGIHCTECRLHSCNIRCQFDCMPVPSNS